MASFHLSREQRERIFDGEAPSIEGRGECPAVVDEPYVVSSSVTLTVVEIRSRPAKATDPDQSPQWSLRYEIHDRRDPVRLMRRVPPVHQETADYRGHDEQDAQESAYTSSAFGAITDGAESPSAKALNIYSMESHQDRVSRQGNYERELLQRRLSERMRALEEAMLTNPNLHRYLTRIERHLKIAEARQRRDAA